MSDPGSDDHQQDIVRQVIRGERPLEDLLAIGLNTTLQVNHRGWYAFQNPNPNGIDVAVDIGDVAAGFLYYYHRRPEQLRPWAFTVYAGRFWHFPRERRDDSSVPHQHVIDALWTVNFTNPVPVETVRLFERLAVSSALNSSNAAAAGSDEDDEW